MHFSCESSSAHSGKFSATLLCLTLHSAVSHLHQLKTRRLDDLKDDSPLRRDKLSTHNIYGTPQTINSATYQYTQATDMIAELSNLSCFRIFMKEMRNLYVEQSYDLY
jgi:ophiobolin F synthase